MTCPISTFTKFYFSMLGISLGDWLENLLYYRITDIPIYCSLTPFYDTGIEHGGTLAPLTRSFSNILRVVDAPAVSRLFNNSYIVRVQLSHILYAC